jgi:hypothetical protein
VFVLRKWFEYEGLVFLHTEGGSPSFKNIETF